MAEEKVTYKINMFGAGATTYQTKDPLDFAARYEAMLKTYPDNKIEALEITELVTDVTRNIRSKKLFPSYIQEIFRASCDGGVEMRTSPRHISCGP